MFYHNKFGQNLRKIFDWNVFLLLTDVTVRLALIILPLSSWGTARRNAPLFASALHQLLFFLYFIISCLLLYKFELTRQARFFLYVLSRPVVLTFPSYPKPLFENEAKCEAFDVKLIVILMQMKHILRPRKWPLNQLFYYDLSPANAADFVWIYCKRKKIPC